VSARRLAVSRVGVVGVVAVVAVLALAAPAAVAQRRTKVHATLRVG
jgi:hypothetical protein